MRLVDFHIKIAAHGYNQIYKTEFQLRSFTTKPTMSEEQKKTELPTAEQQQAQAEAKAAQKKQKAEEAKNEKAAREAKKAERLNQRQQKGAAESAEFVKDPNDPCADKFGDLEMCCSQCDPNDRFTKVYAAVKDLNESHAGQSVRIRGRVHNSRAKGKMCFVVLREGWATVQAALFVGDTISKGMVTFVSKLPKETIVEVIAIVSKPEAAISGCSQQVELNVTEFWCVNKSVPILPFQLEDASRQVLN